MNTSLNVNRLPNVPGVYIMRDSAARIIYIGKANNLKARVSSYFKNSPDAKTTGILSSLKHIDYILCASESDALVLERQLINRYQPYYNAMWKDDKSYPFLKLTLGEDFPRLALTRKKFKDGSEYFGPYPHSQQIQVLMKWLQRMFKWRPCKLELSSGKLPPAAKVKSCLYLHTGRCPAPCAGKISAAGYRENISGLRLFLKGKYGTLAKAWKKDMSRASRELDYEKAAELRDRLSALEAMSQKVTFREVSPEDFAQSLQTSSALEQLKETLGLKKLPSKIECFDISNISGTDSVGSMVKFLNGRPDKSNYRKFRIKTVSGIDDPAMIKEVVSRRYRKLKSEKNALPDLILIDGGPAQLSAAASALVPLKVNIPLASLAKREEEIFLAGARSPVILSKDSPALHILQHARDEAHRFAVSYHHLRRRKRMESQR